MENLKAIHDRHNSFYGKAQINRVGDYIELYSYGTYIGCVHGNQIKLNDYSWYSNTTRRHVREFLKQFFDKNYDEIQFLDGETEFYYRKLIGLKVNKKQRFEDGLDTSNEI